MPEGGWTVEAAASRRAPSRGRRAPAGNGRWPRPWRPLASDAADHGHELRGQGNGPVCAPVRQGPADGSADVHHRRLRVDGAQIGLLDLGGQVPATVTDDQLLAQWKGQIAKDLVGRLPAGASEAGFAFQRRDGKVWRCWRTPSCGRDPAAGASSGRRRPDHHRRAADDEAQYIAGTRTRGASAYASRQCALSITVAEQDAAIDLCSPSKRVLTIPATCWRKPDATQLVYQDTTPAGGRERQRRRVRPRGTADRGAAARAATGGGGAAGPARGDRAATAAARAALTIRFATAIAGRARDRDGQQLSHSPSIHVRPSNKAARWQRIQRTASVLGGMGAALSMRTERSPVPASRTTAPVFSSCALGCLRELCSRLLRAVRT